MRTSDRWIATGVVVIIVIHCSVLITGCIAHRFVQYTNWLNFLAGTSLLVYWIQRKIRIRQHIREMRETVVLSAEVIMTICAAYSIISGVRPGWNVIIQSVFFGLHLLSLLLFLVFMLTFKFKNCFSKRSINPESQFSGVCHRNRVCWKKRHNGRKR